MRIATWNINSVRIRLDLIDRLITDEAPDILCLQETKVVNDAFPRAFFTERGYGHIHLNGMKSYNGVAILSRVPLADTGVKSWLDKDDCRHIFARLTHGTEIHCFYVPAGGDIPDPESNPKFAHKLGFLDANAAWWQSRKSDKVSKILVGDLNIAPLENDVWSHKQMTGIVSHTPVEIEKLTAWQKAHDWYDAMRHFVPDEQKLYSWWSYRASDWAASNRGRRLDHVWVTQDLVPRLRTLRIVSEARGWEPKPSDHVPVLIDIDGAL